MDTVESATYESATFESATFEPEIIEPAIGYDEPAYSESVNEVADDSGVEYIDTGYTEVRRQRDAGRSRDRFRRAPAAR